MWLSSVISPCLYEALVVGIQDIVQVQQVRPPLAAAHGGLGAHQRRPHRAAPQPLPPRRREPHHHPVRRAHPAHTLAF